MSKSKKKVIVLKKKYDRQIRNQRLRSQLNRITKICIDNDAVDFIDYYDGKRKKSRKVNINDLTQEEKEKLERK